MCELTFFKRDGDSSSLSYTHLGEKRKYKSASRYVSLFIFSHFMYKRIHESLQKSGRKIYTEAKRENRLLEGLSLDELKEVALRQEGVIKTQMGSLAADSEPMNRSAPHTKNNVDHPFGDTEEQLAHQAITRLAEERLVCLDTPVGDGADGVTVRFIMPEQYAQIAYGVKLLMDDKREGRIIEDPTYTIIFFTDEHFEANKKKPLLQKISISVFGWGKNGGSR